MGRKLTPKQRAFVEHYLKCWNATEAARLAGYKGNDITLASVGYENIRKPQIVEQIEARLAEVALSANEVLARLTDQATASMADFITVDQKTGQAILDLKKAERLGKLHLIKKFVITDRGGKKLELHDSQAALVHLGKYHKLFIERHEHTGEDGGPIEHKITEVVVEMPPDESMAD